MPDQYDVFLCHNSQDKPEVREIARQLQEKGLRPWLDEWELRPGLPWQPELEKQIQNIRSAAVFVGENGTGPWQQMEIDAYLRRFVRQRCPVIPVLLTNAPKQPELPPFLEGMTWVDFRHFESNPMERLIWGITGVKPSIFNFPQPLVTTPSKHPTIQIFKFDVVMMNAKGQEVRRQKCKAEYFTENLGNVVTLEMVAIPGGTFMMGSPEGEGDDKEKPLHKVTVPPFFIGKYPVTQAQWRAITSLPKVNRDLNPEPSRFKGDKRPVEQVSWYDAVEFCERLSRETGREYRLPSEAEWEYACRAGTTTPFHFGETITSELANYDARYTYGAAVKGTYREQTTPVGSFPPNAFGLYDMHGNVWECCEDDWHSNYEEAPTDGSAWLSSNKNARKVLRGGSWYFYPAYCRSAFRPYYFPVYGSSNIGLRVIYVTSRTT